MTVKIRFERGNLTFVENKIYTFNCNVTKSTMDLRYIGSSRIDGHFIFLIEKRSKDSRPIIDYSYLNISIKEVSIVIDILPHICNEHYLENKRELFDFILNELGLTHTDLLEEGAFKKIKRDIRLSKLLNI